jgi:hydroxymethylbilane synthase
MKDVPTKLPKGIIQAAVLERASYADVVVYKNNADFLKDRNSHAVIATSSIRRKAQWLNRYPNHRLENLRGNVNTRLRKLQENDWNGAIFAAAGLERINLLPENSVKLDWMLPAPAQGAIMVVCREADQYILQALSPMNHEYTALCTKAERDFLRELMGGCSTPISALAIIKDHVLEFRGSILSEDGVQKQEVLLSDPLRDEEGVNTIGIKAAHELLRHGGKEILQKFSNAGG